LIFPPSRAESRASQFGFDSDRRARGRRPNRGSCGVVAIEERRGRHQSRGCVKGAGIAPLAVRASCSEVHRSRFAQGRFKVSFMLRPRSCRLPSRHARRGSDRVGPVSRRLLRQWMCSTRQGAVCDHMTRSTVQWRHRFRSHRPLSPAFIRALVIPGACFGVGHRRRIKDAPAGSPCSPIVTAR
jgi:hypothetical protein